MRSAPLAAAFAAAVALAAVPAYPAASVRGKVVHRDAPVSGVTVAAFIGASRGFPTGLAAAAAASAADGSFALSLPAGRYFIVADRPAAPDTPRLFAYYGGNPVTVGEGESLDIGINCGAVVPPPAASLPGGTGIRGKVLADGAPLPGARVTLYQDAESVYRGLGYASAMTNANGDFALNVEPGTYVAVARKRSSAGFGPMAAGDFFAYSPDNPVEVTDGRYAVIAFAATAKVAREKSGDAEATTSGTVRGGETVIEGTVRRKDGAPAAALWVAAYKDPMMISRPDFVSRSRTDGGYAISLPAGGEYYVGARDTLGAPAAKGELIGRYAGNGEHLVTIKGGEKLTGIDIVVEVVQ